MRLFISYRRQEHEATIELLRLTLEGVVGEGNVFRDDRDIRPGENFPDRLMTELERSDVVLAVIGPKWEPQGLSNPADWVRIELATALDRDIPVVPVLMGGARPPAADALPDVLRRLAGRQAMTFSPRTSSDDVRRMIQRLPRRKSSKLLIFVSSGGTCRDPMAKVIAEQLIAEKRPELGDVRIEGRARSDPSLPQVSYAAGQVIREFYGQDLLAGYRPQKITDEDKREADLILVMSHEQVKGLPVGKTYVLKEFLTGTKGKEGDIADPWGGDGRDHETLQRYRATREEIRSALESGLDRLAETLEV